MVANDYANAVREILTHLETTQIPAIKRAADLIIESVSNGGAVFAHEIGHGNQHDWLIGLAGPRCCIFLSSAWMSPHLSLILLQISPRNEPYDKDSESAEYALRASNMRYGDVLLVSSSFRERQRSR